MRNLKKILALVLALVMSLSLMATAGAAFSDAGEITESYQQAVEVLNGVNVFKGYENGSFVPKGNITRAEAAALIYRIATGDVADTQKDIYTAWNGDGKLSDVSGWYAGYVNYCCNAGYIKGYPNGTFQAQNNVTGYEVLAMVLRAMGYGRNGEFSGSQWAITVGSLAQTLGITKNVKETLGEPATREMVAEIIFRAIFCETQRYNALHLYEGTGTNLAANLNLEKVSGVVTGNKWANLYDNKPMAEGKSRLALDDGSIYTVNADSTGEQIGLRVNAYVQNKTDVIGALETGENVVKSNQGAKTTVKSLRDELKVDDTTEYYVNYNDAVEIGKSDWRIEYAIGLDYTDVEKAALVATNGGEWGYDGQAHVYNKVIRVGSTITALDMEFMQDIFYGSDNENEVSPTERFYGEVFVATRTGSNNLGESYDISDDLSWREFVNKYIDSTLEKFDGCDNGESLRIIDNDGDGVADYVLRVDFVMTTIVDYNKKLDRWTVEYEKDENPERFTDIENSDIVADSELTVGDVILYALVDGVYYTEHPETFTGKIEKKGIDAKAGTIIVDETTYTWSGIEKEAKQFYTEIREADVDTNYVYYKDHFGYVRMFTTPNGDLVLVTDGFFASDKRTDEVKASIYNDDEGKVNDYTLADNKDGFVFDGESDDDDYGNRGTWERLHTFGSYYYEGDTYDKYVQYPFETSNKNDGKLDPFITNVAIGAAEDGTTLQDVRRLEHRNYDYNAYEIGSTVTGTPVTVDGRAVKAAESKDATLWGIEWLNDTNRFDATGANPNDKTDPVEIRTTDMTKYYLVTLTSKGALDTVETWIGRNGGERANFKMNRAYVVTSEASTANVDYKIAEVVVIEGLKETKVADPIMPIRVMGSKNHTQESLTRGGKDTTELYLKARNTPRELSAPVTQLDLMLRFYDGNENGTDKNAEITANYASYGIYAGKMSSHSHTGWRVDDTIYRAELRNELDEFAPYGEVEFYRLVVNKAEEANGDPVYAYDVEEVDNMNNLSGNRVIYLTNTDDKVNVILNLDQTVDTKGNEIDAPDQLIDLYNEIVYDYMQYTWVRLLTAEGTLTGHIKSCIAEDASSLTGEYAPADPVRIPLDDIRNPEDLEFVNDDPSDPMDVADWTLTKNIASGGISIRLGTNSDDTAYDVVIDNTNMNSWKAPDDTRTGDAAAYKNVWFNIANGYLYINGLDYANGQWAEVYVHYTYTGADVAGRAIEDPTSDPVKDAAGTPIIIREGAAPTGTTYDPDTNTPELLSVRVGDPVDADDPANWVPGSIVEVTMSVRQDHTPAEPRPVDADGNAVRLVKGTFNNGKSALNFVGLDEGKEAVDVTVGDTTVSMNYYTWTYSFVMGTSQVTLGTPAAKNEVADEVQDAIDNPVVPDTSNITVSVSDTDNLEVTAGDIEAESNLKDVEITLKVKTGVTGKALPDTLTKVTIGSTELTADTDYTYNSTTGVIKFLETTKTASADDITITATAKDSDPGTSNITVSVSDTDNLEVTAGDIEAESNLKDVEITLKVKTGVTGKALPDTLTKVTIGSTELTADTDYTYNSTTGVIKFLETTKTASADDITITATAKESV